MDYIEELRNVLRPLRLYDVDTGLGGAELTAIGTDLNRVWAGLMDAETEFSPMTAVGAGLDGWEALLPFVPAYRTAADRRRAIAALLRIDGTSFTLEAVNDTVAGCGIRAVVEETDEPMTVQVYFPYNRGEPDDLEELQARIEQIIPCHLAVEYVFVYVLWMELEVLCSNWQEVENVRSSWRQLERLGGED